MSAVNWGIISTARINRLFLGGAGEARGVELLAVASRDTVRAEQYAREHGFPRAHGSYDELLADPDVEAVYVSLPNSQHVERSVRALEAGKHVLCEKRRCCSMTCSPTSATLRSVPQRSRTQIDWTISPQLVIVTVMR